MPAPGEGHREPWEQGDRDERPFPGPQPLDAELLDRRVVRLWGPLDDSTVAKACAEMMALDATGDEAVQLYIGSAGGPVHSAMSLIDTMDLLGVPVHVTCLGRAEGAAVGVVAAGARRVAAPHAQFHLTEPEVSVSGNASQLAAWAEHHRVELERFVQRLAQATGRPAEHLEADLSLGRWLDAEEALRYGLVDEIWGPGARPRPSLGWAANLGPAPPVRVRPRPALISANVRGGSHGARIGQLNPKSSPRVLVAPEGAGFAVDAVRQGGGELAKYGEAVDGLVWATFNSKGLRETIVDHPDIRWVQLPVAGIEHFVETGIFSAASSDDVVWTCAKGTYAQQVAEMALGLAIAGLRELPERARARSWGGQAGISLYDQPVTILGGGGITEELLRLLAPFRVHATVVRKTSRPVEGAERTVGPEELHSVLPGALIVFVALALTPETVRVISRNELALMGRDAWLVNIARGRHVDTDALVAYLTERRIGGAALDVTDPEPLPDGHPLWSLPNCLITPHVANTEKTAPPFLAARIKENVERFAAGLPLVGTVDTAAGY